jgi:hypothetical protein
VNDRLLAGYTTLGVHGRGHRCVEQEVHDGHTRAMNNRPQGESASILMLVWAIFAVLTVASAGNQLPSALAQERDKEITAILGNTDTSGWDMTLGAVFVAGATLLTARLGTSVKDGYDWRSLVCIYVGAWRRAGTR